MRVSLIVLAVTARAAMADGVVEELALEPVEPLPQAPALQAATCEGRGMLARTSRVVGTARATVVHECGEADTRGLLALRTGERWFLAPNGWVSLERVTSNIIRRITFARDHLGTGELAGGAAAVVYTLETLNGTKDPLRVGRVLVCSTGPAVACARPIAFSCEPGGCTAPRLSRGVLIVDDADDGELRYTLRDAEETD